MNKTTVWKLIIASLVVGLLLSFFEIDPAELIRNVPETIGKILDAIWSVIEWGIKYIILGAIIVVPVWLLFNLGDIWKKIKGRKQG